MTETTYYDKDGVRITGTLATIEGQTFSIANISSVVVHEHGRNLIGPLIFGLAGLGSLAGGSDWDVMYYVGLALLALAVFTWWRGKPSYHLIVETGATRFDAYERPDKALVLAAKTAISEAIARRG